MAYMAKGTGTMPTRITPRRLFGMSLILSLMLAGCADDASQIERDSEPMEPAPAPTTGKCGLGQVLTCICMGGGAGTQRCLDTGVFGECTCRAADQQPMLGACQPGSRVVCDCPGGGIGNQLCRPDATFEDCSMCIGGDPAVDSDAG